MQPTPWLLSVLSVFYYVRRASQNHWRSFTEYLSLAMLLRNQNSEKPTHRGGGGGGAGGWGVGVVLGMGVGEPHTGITYQRMEKTLPAHCTLSVSLFLRTKVIERAHRQRRTRQDEGTYCEVVVYMLKNKFDMVQLLCIHWLFL